MSTCFVLLPDSKALTRRTLERALKEFPQLGELEWLASSQEAASEFAVSGLKVLAALVPMPVAQGEMNGATNRSLSGLDGSWVLPEHRAHLVVVQQGKAKATLKTMTAFTRIVAAIVRATGAVAVCWDSSGATHHPEFVVNIAHSELPLPVWVGVSISKHRTGSELLSIGMRQLGLPDLLLSTAKVEPGVLEFFYDLLGYIAGRGKPLPEGDSVGRTQSEKLKVRYLRSPTDAHEKVWAITVPAVRVAQPKKRTAVKVKKKPVRAGTGG